MNLPPIITEMTLEQSLEVTKARMALEKNNADPELAAMIINLMTQNAIKSRNISNLVKALTNPEQ